jgi:hypothetical protein
MNATDTDTINTALAVLPPELPGILTEGVTITPTGATFHEETPQETVEYVMRRAAELGRASHYIIGDAINHEEGRGREDFARWSGITGISDKELRNVSRVCRKVKMEHRPDQTEFGFARLVANLPESDQIHVLNVAKEKGLDKSETRRFIHTGQATKGAPPVDAGADNIAPHVGKILALVEKLEGAGMLGEAERATLLALHKDFLPLFKAHARVVRVLVKRGDGDALRRIQSDLATASRPA